ncbi:MAG: 30S ribosomal protein S16 [Malacoplasma sp.]|nr:30S ribosomal protein S16 [Malacoplasma sp.]
MVKIRLTRLGKHKVPFYRIVAIDSRSRRDGAYINQVGTYEPFKGEVKINENDVLVLLNQGAQPTDTVRSLLKKQGIWKKFMEAKLANKKANAVNKKEKPAKKTVTKKTTKTNKK